MWDELTPIEGIYLQDQEQQQQQQKQRQQQVHQQKCDNKIPPFMFVQCVFHDHYVQNLYFRE